MGEDAAGGEGVAEGVLDVVGAAGEGVVGADGVVRDEGEARAQAGAGVEVEDEVGEGGGVGGAVVVVVEEGDGEHRREAGEGGVLAGGGEGLRERLGAVDRHEAAAQFGAGAGEREAEADLRGLAGEAADPGGEAGGAHGDGAGVDGEGGGVGEDRDRREHAVEVGERLAHALEDDAADAGAGGQVCTHEPDLLDDLPRLEVALEAEAAGGAEGTGEGAADLGADTDGEAVGRGERDPDALEQGAVVGDEQVLDEGVDAAGSLGANLQGGHVGAGSQGGEALAADLGDRAVEQRGAAADRGGHDAAGLGGAELGEEARQGARFEALEGVHAADCNSKVGGQGPLLADGRLR